MSFSFKKTDIAMQSKIIIANLVINHSHKKIKKFFFIQKNYFTA
jgi:hypothetical protein